MSNITKEAVMDLREKTGAGLIDCKRALAETNGDLDEAISILRKKGVASAAKKAGREAGEGIISNAVSADRKKGILVEVNCETDFVAKNEDFIKFSKEVAETLLSEPNKDLENKIKLIQAKEKQLKLVSAISDDSDNKQYFKNKIDYLIQEIDYCIDRISV